MLPSALLRSLFRLGDEPEDALVHNLFRVRMELRPEGVDGIIIAYAGTTTERAQRVPTLAQMRQHFRDRAAEGDGVAQAALGRLDSIDPQEPFLSRVDFHQALHVYKEDLLQRGLGDLLIQTSQILTTGYTVTERTPSGKWEPVTYKGGEHALTHLARGAASLRTATRQGFVDGDFRSESELLKAYIVERVRRGTGVLTGLAMIDKIHQGIQPGELALVMGYSGQMKTTLVVNWAYHAVVYQRRNVGFVSLETPADVLRAIIYAMHAAHPRFRSHGKRLDYDKLVNGLLTPEESAFFDLVVQDFTENPDYGRFLYKAPSSAVTIDEIHAWAELRHHQTPLSLLVVDYLALVDPDQKIFDKQQAGSGLNRVIRQAKLMAMSFGGKGIAVVSPHQANREGYTDAEKNGGRYRLTALANANEAERSSDLVYYTYLDESLRASHELALGNLKNRNGKLFTEQIRVYADPTSRLIRDTDPHETAQGLVPL